METIKMFIKYCNRKGGPQPCYTGICNHCHNIFYSFFKSGKYCNNKCIGLANKTGCQIPCIYCGKTKYICDAKIKRHKFHFCGNICKVKYWRGKNHSCYRDNIKGYRKISIGGKRFKQHKLILENKIGRKLKKNEVTHHLDENKSNNNPSNLIVLTKSEHRCIHNYLRYSSSQPINFRNTGQIG